MPHEIDQLARIGNGLSHDHSAFHKVVKFCPRCGVRSLLRHERKVARDGRSPIDGAEFWCTSCGFSFNVRASVEWKLALEIFREHRSLRTLHRFTEQFVAPEVVEAWKKEEFMGQPTRKLGELNSARGRGWNLGEKLMKALRG